MASRGDIKAGRAYVELYLKNSALTKGLKSIRKQAQQISDEFLRMGRTLTTIGVAMAIPIALATKRFADFDDQMRTVKAVTQSGEADFQRLTETAKRLGATTSFTAVEVAQMMTELGRAGFTADQIDVMTTAVLNLARASGTEGAVAAGIMAATIRQFGLDATDAARVADVLTAAANKTFNTVESLGEALSYAGPVAADFGMSIEQTLALLGALGNVGIQGSEGGTAVRRLLALSAAEAKEWGDNFGVTMLDTAGNVRPLIDVLEEIRTATAGMGTAERGAKFKEAFGILGITAASSLGKNAVNVRELEAALLNAGGTAATTAKEMDAGLGGSLRILLSAVEGVAIAIGEALAPTLIQIGDVMIPVLQVFTEFLKQNKGIVQIVAGAVVGLLSLGGALLAIGMTFGAIAFAIGGFFSAITLVTGTIGMIGTAFAALISPIGLLTIAIIGGGAAWLYYSGVVKSVLEWIANAVQPYVDIAVQSLDGIRAALASGNLELAAKIATNGILLAFEMLKLELMTTWAGLRNGFLGVWDSIVAETAASLAFIGSLFSDVMGAIGETDFVKTLAIQWEGFRIAAGIAFDYVLSYAKAVIATMNAIRKVIFQTVQDVAAAAPALAAVAIRAGAAGPGALAAVGVAKLGLNTLLDNANRAGQEARDVVGVGQRAGNRAMNDLDAAAAQQDVIDKQRKLLEDQIAQAKEDLRVAGEDRKAALPDIANPGGAAAVAEIKGAAFGTFSAAALAGQGFGGMPKLEKIAGEQKNIAEKQLAAQVKADAEMIQAIKDNNVVFGRKR